MSRTAVFAFLILSLLAAFTFGGALLLVINEGLMGRMQPPAALAGLAVALLAAALALLWFQAALQLSRATGRRRGGAVRSGAWAAALLGAAAAAASLLQPGVWPFGMAVVAISLLAALPHMGPAGGASGPTSSG